MSFVLFFFNCPLNTSLNVFISIITLELFLRIAFAFFLPQVEVLMAFLTKVILLICRSSRVVLFSFPQRVSQILLISSNNRQRHVDMVFILFSMTLVTLSLLISCTGQSFYFVCLAYLFQISRTSPMHWLLGWYICLYLLYLIGFAVSPELCKIKCLWHMNLWHFLNLSQVPDYSNCISCLNIQKKYFIFVNTRMRRSWKKQGNAHTWTIERQT